VENTSRSNLAAALTLLEAFQTLFSFQPERRPPHIPRLLLTTIKAKIGATTTRRAPPTCSHVREARPWRPASLQQHPSRVGSQTPRGTTRV
jgi:hypothetical protein